MTWTTKYSPSAARAIRKLDQVVRERIRDALQKLGKDPKRGKQLRLGLTGLRTWRTGPYRIIYRLIESRIEIIVVAIGHRREVYKKLQSWRS